MIPSFVLQLLLVSLAVYTIVAGPGRMRDEKGHEMERLPRRYLDSKDASVRVMARKL